LDFGLGVQFGLPARFGLRRGRLLPPRGGFGSADQAAAGGAALFQLPLPVTAAGFDRSQPPGAAGFPLDLGEPGAPSGLVFGEPF
jgi:hypothetical protein